MRSGKYPRGLLFGVAAVLLGVATFAGHSLTATTTESRKTPLTELFSKLTAVTNAPQSDFKAIYLGAPALVAGPCSGPARELLKEVVKEFAKEAAKETAREVVKEVADKARGGKGSALLASVDLRAVTTTKFDVVPVGGR